MPRASTRPQGPLRREKNAAIYPSAWKDDSEKYEHPIGPAPIQIYESLCTTTTYSAYPYGIGRLRRYPHCLLGEIYAGSCKRSSQNLPSTHSGE